MFVVGGVSRASAEECVPRAQRWMPVADLPGGQTNMGGMAAVAFEGKLLVVPGSKPGNA